MLKTEGILLYLFLPRTRGECIAHFRNLLELRQFDISKELGINRTSISKMENEEINVSENVWSHVLNLIYQNYDIEQSIPFIEFQNLLELYIEDDEVNGRQIEWTKQKLSLQPETSI